MERDFFLCCEGGFRSKIITLVFPARDTWFKKIGGKMFDLSKLGDMTKIANEAKEMQARQEKTAQEQTDLLRKISVQLETVIALLKK